MSIGQTADLATAEAAVGLAPGRSAEAIDYLTALYGKCESGDIVFVTSDRNEVSAVFSVADLDAAAAHVEASGADLFLKVNVMDREKTTARNPRGIGGKDEVAAVVSFHLDVDAGKNDKYLTPERMLDALDSMPLAPSAIIQTNGDDGGFHAYWFLCEPHYITSEDDRRDCQTISTRWLEELRHHATPGTIDGTANLDRILRPVGSLRKSGNRVRALTWSPNRRYRLDDFRVAARNPQPEFTYTPHEGESVIARYLNDSRETVEGILSRQNYTHVRDGFWRRRGSESGSPTGEVFVLPDGRRGFTVKSGAADPLTCENRDGSNGRWYSCEELFVVFEHGGDWKAAAKACHEYFEEKEPKVNASGILNQPPGKRISWADARKTVAAATGTTASDWQEPPDGPPANRGMEETSRPPESNRESVPLPIVPVAIGKLIDSYPDLRPVVVDGILRRGETANIIAAAKVGKSFLGGNLAWCVATGQPWLSHDVQQGKVLIIDNELHPETLASRLSRIAVEMMVDVREYGDAIDVISLRGQNIDIHAIESRLAAIKAGTYTLALVDALYRTIPAGTSENDNAAMMSIYNRLDHYASAWDCAIAVVHHTSKGQQGDKSITDVGSGAGSISRAADTHIVIRPHEDPELSVLECVTRSFLSPKPVSIRFKWPLWHAVGTAPEVKKLGRQNQEAQAKADKEDSAAILAAIPLEPKAIQQKKILEQFGFGVSKTTRLIGGLVRDDRVKVIRRRKKGGKRSLVFYMQTQSNSGSDSGSDSGTT